MCVCVCMWRVTIIRLFVRCINIAQFGIGKIVFARNRAAARPHDGSIRNCVAKVWGQLQHDEGGYHAIGGSGDWGMAEIDLRFRERERERERIAERKTKSDGPKERLARNMKNWNW